MVVKYTEAEGNSATRERTDSEEEELDPFYLEKYTNPENVMLPKDQALNAVNNEVTLKEDVPKEDAPKEDAAKEDVLKELSKKKVPIEDALKEDVSKQVSPKQDVPKEDVLKEVSKEDVLKEVVPKEYAPEEDAPKEEEETESVIASGTTDAERADPFYLEKKYPNLSGKSLVPPALRTGRPPLDGRDSPIASQDFVPFASKAFKSYSDPGIVCHGDADSSGYRPRELITPPPSTDGIPEGYVSLRPPEMDMNDYDPEYFVGLFTRDPLMVNTVHTWLNNTYPPKQEPMQETSVLDYDHVDSEGSSPRSLSPETSAMLNDWHANLDLIRSQWPSNGRYMVFENHREPFAELSSPSERHSTAQVDEAIRSRRDSLEVWVDEMPPPIPAKSLGRLMRQGIQLPYSGAAGAPMSSNPDYMGAPTTETEAFPDFDPDYMGEGEGEEDEEEEEEEEVSPTFSEAYAALLEALNEMA